MKKEMGRLRLLAEKATPGPWVQEEGNFAAVPNGRVVLEVPCQGANDADLPFLIALRNAWPEMERAYATACEALRTINRTVYSVGAPLGSENYFEVRKAAADTLRSLGEKAT